MKERPILFSAPMVRAILDGSKTKTRRVVKPIPQMVTDKNIATWDGDAAALMRLFDQVGRSCPYGHSGERLWVRESWRVAACYDDKSGTELTSILSARNVQYEVAADRFLHGDAVGRLRPSIHMPRWASRIDLEITGVRVERLQDISEQDAEAEGVRNSLHIPSGRFARENFEHLWWTIHGDDSWEANPWVWVIEFKRSEK